MQSKIYQRQYICGPTTLTLGSRTLIMGILNVTPDSFSDGGRYNNLESAVAHAKQLMADGADLIDIGGESTRPGFAQVPEEEELRRVIPVIEAIHTQAPEIPISVDTYKAEVARQALQAGAHIINDVWGFKKDPKMAAVAAQAGCPVILMHNRQERDYKDYMKDILADLRDSIRTAKDAGVVDEQIMVDPGIGFAKNARENLYFMQHLDALHELGYPILLATSRKRFIRDTLQLPVDDLVEGTAATVAFGIAQGCQIVRVHDVAQIHRTVKMCDAMYYAEQPMYK